MGICVSSFFQESTEDINLLIFKQYFQKTIENIPRVTCSILINRRSHDTFVSNKKLGCRSKLSRTKVSQTYMSEPKVSEDKGVKDFTCQCTHMSIGSKCQKICMSENFLIVCKMYENARLMNEVRE